MKKHTTEQIVRKLREGEVLAAQGKGIAEIRQALEVSSKNYHRWKKKYEQLGNDSVRRSSAGQICANACIAPSQATRTRRKSSGRVSRQRYGGIGDMARR